ncbi:MAG TPA: hypothetical protein DD379_22420 [Cyanobacteria bacterium UBA11162]|nr:hypothetical protein [Cyanobacteria bacterium UBA11370]HBL14092.1 hypothetical protein [Cyanobacteria bacterium UBA11162]HBY76062.1 hypothetical protein [Cyanobacteria bacterium UBA11148]
MNFFLVALYLTIAIYLLRVWLRFFAQERGISNNKKALCLITFAIATLFWPIVVPIAYVKLLEVGSD